jgi:hypothetical protein
VNPAEQAETLPAASVAVALNVVEAFKVTETLKPGDANAAALPVPTGVPEQSVEVYSLTVEPAAAVPKMLGLPLLDGEAGEEPSPVGAVGAIESWT